MLKINDSSVLNSPSDMTIQSEEKFYRIKFPDAYIAFIKKYNGCIPITKFFDVGNNKYVLERFICILGEDRDSYEQGWSDMGVVIEPIYECLTDNEDELGITIIPVGILFAGDLLCLDFRTNASNPNICIWHRDDSYDFEPVTTKVADNFEQFLNMLK